MLHEPPGLRFRDAVWMELLLCASWGEVADDDGLIYICEVSYMLRGGVGKRDNIGERDCAVVAARLRSLVG